MSVHREVLQTAKNSWVPIITLLTDYGPGSEHVGALHAVLASRCPEADRIDLAHDIPPGDIRFGSVALARLVPLAPPGVHLAVVDPGVGTARRGIAASTPDGRFVVGPDNGLLGPACRALGAQQAVELSSPDHRREPVAPTFHGRDVFAPAAAHLASGGRLADLGPAVPVGSIAQPELPAPRARRGAVEAIVLGVDRFGNLQLLASASDLAAAGLAADDALTVGAGGAAPPARLGRVYADVPRRELLVHVDSHGQVAVAVHGASAAQRLRAGPGDWITIAATR